MGTPGGRAHQILPATLLFAVLLAGTSCRETTEGPVGGGTLLGTPSVLVESGLLRAPRGIAVDNGGDVWVADTYNNAIKRFTPSGSQSLLLPGYIEPRGMGLDRASGAILTVVDGSSLLRIDPRTASENVFALITASSVDTSAVFDTFRARTAPRVMLSATLGDIDGAPGGAVYVGLVANAGENFVVQVQGGVSRAIAHSSQVIPVSVQVLPQYVACGDGGAVYTGFYYPTGSSNASHRAHVLYPSGISLSGVMEAIQISGGVTGGGYDRAGYILLADQASRELVIASVASERIIERLPMPEVLGMVQPTPTDVAAAPDGTVYLSVRDQFDTSNRVGAVLRFPRAPIR